MAPQGTLLHCRQVQSERPETTSCITRSSQLSSTRTSFHHGCRQLHIQIARSLEGRGEPTVRHAWKHSNSSSQGMQNWCRLLMSSSCCLHPQPALRCTNRTPKTKSKHPKTYVAKWTPTSSVTLRNLPRLVTVRSSRSRGVFPWEGSPALAAVPRLGRGEAFRCSDAPVTGDVDACWHTGIITGCRQPGGA